MRPRLNFLQTSIGKPTDAISSRRSRTLLGAFVALALYASNAQAADTDSINPTTMGKIEKNLRELGQRAKDAAADISSTALGLVGVNYKFGGNTPDTGLDCSGFVRYVFQQATGISLPRSAREQAKVGQTVDKDQLQPGDLVFFNTRRFQFSHVGVYLGDNRFIHSPSRGGSVEVVNFDNSYWQKTFNGARRVLGAVVASDANATSLREAKQIEAALRKQQAEQMQRDQARVAVEAALAKETADRANATSSPFTRDY
ncbi:MAG: C40 family peptidase [Casimicrobium sp.]